MSGKHHNLIIAGLFFSDIINSVSWVFNNSLDSDTLNRYSFRRLGLSSSFDTASLFSVSSLILNGLWVKKIVQLKSPDKIKITVENRIPLFMNYL